MTKPIAEKLAARNRAQRRAARTIFGRMAERLRTWLGELGEWPKVQYQKDPVGFARDVLGYVPCRTTDEVRAEVKRARAAGMKPRILWSKQIDILEALAKSPRARVAVRSGHKVSKSHTAAIAALWFYASFPDARVFLTAVTARQVDSILWRELKKVHFESTVKVDGVLADKAATGLKGHGFREIFGFTAREKEAVAGASGANILYICDEASGIPDELFETIEGNSAGGGRTLMLSNPTQTSGTFFDAFHSKKDFYVRIHVSSADTPNAVTGEDLIPGLATRAYIEEKKREYGEGSAWFMIRVLGNFVLNEDAKIISMHAIMQAVERWKDLEERRAKNQVKPEGRLYLGVDPAGPSVGGDESTIVPRRGLWMLNLLRFRGLNEDALLAQVLGTILTYKLPREEPPVVVVDKSGPVGIKVIRKFRAYLETPGHENDFELVAVVSSDKATDPLVRCDRVRDQLWWRLSEWFRDGGAIVDDARLHKELHVPKWFTPPGRDVLKATPKDDIKAEIGHSPDAADGLALSVWEGRDADRQAREEKKPAKDMYEAPREIDPYAVDGGAGADAVYGDGGRDPVYGR